MATFDDELRRALKKTEPSAEFTARVLARVAADGLGGFGPGKAAWFGWWRMAAVAAGLAVVTSVGVYKHHEHEVRGEAAKQQLLLAMRIAGQSLQSAQERVNEVAVQ